jgi:hypothetical protein
MFGVIFWWQEIQSSAGAALAHKRLRTAVKAMM